jgi:hypothetical protein
MLKRLLLFSGAVASIASSESTAMVLIDGAQGTCSAPMLKGNLV